SLQKERRLGDEAHLPPATKMLDLAPYLHDFCETTAAVEKLDLVIAVDTAVAHIAGALGTPCWLLLPANSDFRWLTEREDTPWYPTMRLFRQQRLGQWADVVDRVTGALQQAVHTRSTADAVKALLPPASKSRVAPPAEDGRAASLLSRVAETRYGILQYSPCEKTLAQSLDWYGEGLEPQLEFLAPLLR